MLSLALGATAALPSAADWNHTHIFSEVWSPHARFHGVVGTLVAFGMGCMGLWLVWR